MTAAPNARMAADPDAGGATGAGAVRNCLRGGLVLLAAIQAGMGGWQYFAPRSFYYEIPTVSADRPFSAHLMTDVGGLNLALVVVLAAAAWRLDRTLTRAALALALLLLTRRRAARRPCRAFPKHGLSSRPAADGAGKFHGRHRGDAQQRRAFEFGPS
jgi:hypothetical protein